MANLYARLSASLILLLSALLAGGAAAGQNGALGTSSSGTATITLTKAPLYRISNIQDIAFPHWTGKPLRTEQRLCVYASVPGWFTLTFFGSGAGDAFHLADDTRTVEYHVGFQYARRFNSVHSWPAAERVRSALSHPPPDPGCRRWR